MLHHSRFIVLSFGDDCLYGAEIEIQLNLSEIVIDFLFTGLSMD
jgi:hypothetical protein